MTSSISTPEDVRLENVQEKFVPKRRAPYLLQEEIIKKTLVNEFSNESVNLFVDEEKSEDLNEKPTNIKLVVNKESYKYSSQLVINHEINYHEEVSKLYGIQKRIAHYFVNCCIARHNVFTGPITAENLCRIANTTKKTLKKILQRMVEKKLIKRVDGKRGKGGFSVFRLDQEFIDVIRLQLDLEKNHFSENQRYNSRQILTNTNTSEKILPKEWQDINFNDIKEIGFGLPQLRQIYHKNILSPELVQCSIDHFAFALKNKPDKLKKYTDVLSAFMSVLHKGGSWIEKDYISPQLKAEREKLAALQKELEELQTIEEQKFETAFKIWSINLDNSEKEAIFSKYPKIFEINKSITHKVKIGYLKEHFRDFVYGK